MDAKFLVNFFQINILRNHDSKY